VTRFDPSGPLRGALRPPPDKSISHRAALIAAMGEGETRIEGYLDAADTRSTLGAVAGLGAVPLGVEGTTGSAPAGISPAQSALPRSALVARAWRRRRA
jgi:3-phosphoshikimate 1-carboxyvinyltransferase